MKMVLKEYFLLLCRHSTVQYTLVCVIMAVFANILVNTVILVLSESKQLRKKTYVTVYCIRAALRLTAV